MKENNVLTEIIEDNYKSIVKRGLITPETTVKVFIDKLYEELGEMEVAHMKNDESNLKEELADIILVALNTAKHFNIDIEEELKKKIKINYTR